MMSTDATPQLQDESDLRWCWLEEEPDACVVVSERMELIYVNTAGRELVSGDWFGKRCFETFPVADETCAFHCPKIHDVSESREVVYCEEMVRPSGHGPDTFGVGLIPLGANDGRARAVFVMRKKEPGGNDTAFQAALLRDAEGIRRRMPTTEQAIRID